MGIDLKGINNEQLEVITSVVLREQRKSKKKEGDRRLRNTKMLLQNYRRLGKHIQIKPGDEELTLKYEAENGVIIRFDELNKYC